MSANHYSQADYRFLALLLAASAGAVAAKLLGVGGSAFLAGNAAIVLGYLYVAVNIAPYFKVDRGTKIAAISFFVLCASTHTELIVHAALDRPLDYESWHMVLIHALQAASILRFVYGLRRSAIVDRDTLRDLTDSAEVDQPHGKSVRKAREALGE